jgi:hypothetical protein
MQHGVTPAPSENTEAQAMMREMHDAMLRDPAIRARVLANPALRAHQQHLESMGAVDSLPKAPPARRSSPATPAAKRPPAKMTPKATPKPADPHAGHVMTTPKPPVKKPPTESIR